MVASTNDHVLLEALRRGDGAAFVALLERYGGAMLADFRAWSDARGGPMPPGAPDRRSS